MRDAVGSKAANLAQLKAAGFLVPDGFVLTTEAFTLFLESNRIDPNAVPEQIEQASLPSEIVAALRQGLKELKDVKVAVRSSAIAEDLADSSYAGQYESILNISGQEALQHAVRKCWASAFSERVKSYEKKYDQKSLPEMAVLIQSMVAADVAGVAFTANPTIGIRNEVVINAVSGLGECLVSGEATPEQWVISKNVQLVNPRSNKVLTESQAQEVAGLAQLVEKYYETPQDIEWAIAKDQLYLLQARPVTGLSEEEPIPVPVEVSDGAWFRDMIHFPRPFSPLFASIYLPAYNKATRTAFQEFGILIDGVELRIIGGWPYIRIIPPMDKTDPPPPNWLLPVLMRVVPPLHKKMQRAREALRSDLAGSLLDDWWQTWRPEFEAKITQKAAVDLSVLDDMALARHFNELVSLFERMEVIHFRLFPPHMLAVTDAVFFCRDVLGWEESESMALFAGLSKTSSAPGDALAELGLQARERPAVMQALKTIDENTLEQLEEIDPEFLAAFNSYQNKYGLRIPIYDLDHPCDLEQPQLMLHWLRDHGQNGSPPDGKNAALEKQREEKESQAHSRLSGLPQQAERFTTILERLEKAYPAREDNEFFSFNIMSLMRLSSLEIGRRMAARSHLKDSGDIFYLEIDEVRQWLRQPADIRGTASRRLGERLWIDANPGPQTYGPQAPPPDVSSLPAEMCHIMTGLLWIIKNDVEPKIELHEGGIRGVGASPGRFTGLVRIIHSPEEFHKVQKGDVLVCPMTTASWSTLFASLGALVTDSGGLLSHPAIIAREFGIPAVLATGNATAKLCDGQLVTVNGSAGTVEIVE